QRIEKGRLAGGHHSSVLRESQDFGLNRTGHSSISLADDHIDFRTHAEVRKVHAGFARKARAWKQTAVVMGFVAVHIDAVAGDSFAETMSSCVKDFGRIARFLQDRRGGAIDFPAAHWPAFPGGLLNERNGCVARTGDGAECPRIAVRYARSRI